MLEMLLFAMGLDSIDELVENDAPEPSPVSGNDVPLSRSSSSTMSVSAGQAGQPLHDVPEIQEKNDMEPQQVSAVSEPEGGQSSACSAPASPCVVRKPPQTLNVDSSRIPQPLTSPTPLRRSGSLRLRGEKQGFGHGGHGRTRVSPGAAFPSITEAAESWKQSLRGAGDGMVSGHGHGPAPAGSPAGNSSNLRQMRHHRSLQSLASRSTSRDSYPFTPTPSPEEIDLFRPQNLNRFLLDHAKEFCGDQDDLDSLRSYGSNCSTQSACDHAQFARNGTTFSGKRMKYIVHCSSHPEPNEYLTPTQRANHQIRRLKALVEQSRKDLESKDESIFKLTKEVVELRLLRDESDGSPVKTTANLEGSPVCKVAVPLENECFNSTSLSDSGHFDDVLSLTSAQSAQSPGPRQHVSSPESERLAEIYQRKIEDVTRKQGEKSVEDRKSLVDMYEKKMEDMSRKSREKFQQEKNDFVEMYEKKIEDIVRRHEDKLQEERTAIQDSYEKKIGNLSQKLENHEMSVAASQDDTIQVLAMKLEESQRLLGIAEGKVSSLTQQLEDTNLRYSELQQDLFQSREKTVLLEEEVETLQNAVTTQEQQLSDKQVALIQVAQLEAEVHILQQHLDEQKEMLETKLQLENELERVLDKLKEAELKCEKLEVEQIRAADLHEEKHKEVSELNSKLNSELARVTSILKEAEETRIALEHESNTHKKQLKQVYEEKSKLDNELARMSKCMEKKEQQCLELEKNKVDLELSTISDAMKEAENVRVALEHQTTVQAEELNQLLGDKSKLEVQLAQISDCLKARELKYSEMEKSKATLEALYEEEQKMTLQSRSQFEHDLAKTQDLLNEEKQKNMILELENSELSAMKNEYIRTQELVSQLKNDLASLNLRFSEEELKNSELLNWKTEHQQKTIGLNQELKMMSEHSESLEEEIEELQNSLDEINQSKKMQDSTLQDLKEKLHRSHAEAERHTQVVQNLTQQIDDANASSITLSALLSEEKNRNEELLHFKREAEKLVIEIKSLKEDVIVKNQQLQYLSGIENDLTNLKDRLKVETDKVEELLPWKSKARDLEEELKSLKEEITEQIKKMHLVNELSESINRDVNSLKLPLKQSVSQDHILLGKLMSEGTPDEAHERTVELEAEVEKLKESLDQSYWSLSEKETVILETEKTLSEQTQKLHELETEVMELRSKDLKNFVKSPSEDVVLLPTKIPLLNASANIGDVVLNGDAYANATDIVPHLKAEIESLRKALSDQEERHTEMNLKMYLKGQEAAKFERKDQVLEMAAHAPEKVSIPELLTQLAETERELDKVKDNQLENMPKSSLSLLSASEAVCLYLLGSFKSMYRQLAEGQANNSSSPEATLLFLKDAFYYFMTDEANCQGHLHAIQSILGFTESEKQSIDTLTYIRR